MPSALTIRPRSPEELPRRLIKLLSFPGDLVVDPFVGSGTSAFVAHALGRRFWACDRNPSARPHSRERQSTLRVADSRYRVLVDRLIAALTSVRPRRAEVTY
jgi:DNA modification methylase